MNRPPPVAASSGVDMERVLEHVRWFGEHTPNRISGGGQDALAAEYIATTLSGYGLEATLQAFDTYSSRIGSGRLEVTGPDGWSPRVKPCLHVDSTPPEGIEAELISVGAGGREDYERVDARGKILLAEVSYAPATPEKARLAFEHGAAGMVLMNWGREDQDNIPWRALKSVWGNPTRSTWPHIPRLPAVAVTRRDGERLKRACQRGTVAVTMAVHGERYWANVVQPLAWLRAPASSAEAQQFAVVSGHLDAWEPGVTDNATGNAVMLEIARVLAGDRDRLRRSVVFCFWNGHEIAEAAGSTYFVDTHWEALQRAGVMYANIDSVGMRGADRFTINTSPELRGVHRLVPAGVLPESLEVAQLQRIGDQSFFGVGVPAVSARHAFSPEMVQGWNGATLGWWNHSEQDTDEQLDTAVLERDARFWAALIASVATEARLPYRMGVLVEDLRTRWERVLAEGEAPDHLAPVTEGLRGLEARATWLDGLEPRDDRQVCLINDVKMQLSRHLTSVRATVVGRYGQDSYGLTDLQEPIPMLAPLHRYRELAQGDGERYLIATELMRVRQKFSDAVNASIRELDALEARLSLDGRVAS